MIIQYLVDRSMLLHIVSYLSIPLVSFLLVSMMVVMLKKANDHRPLPPGPRALPIIGNLHQIPTTNPWETYQKWHRTYGPIISFRLGSRLIISIGSHEVADELLNKRGHIYSSRPPLIISGHLTKGLHMGINPAGPKWKNDRKILSQFLSMSESKNYCPMQDTESKQVVRDLLRSDAFASHFDRYAGGLMMSFLYGRRISSSSHPDLCQILDISEKVDEAVNQNQNRIVEAFPALDLLPEFLSPWKQIGNQAYSITTEIFERLFNQGKTNARAWASQVQKVKGAESLPTSELAYLLGILNQGGGETTAAVLRIFVLASLLHHGAVLEAQKELDRVVGQDRLPTFDDMLNLPYVNAFIHEVQRWHPLLPAGVPHATTQDDIYMGYHIPKGTTILPNHWTLDLDADSFDAPLSFQPTRWLENPDLPTAAFGFGRRVCPGKYIAQNSLFIVISRVLWAYDICPAYKDGKKVPVRPWNLKQSIVGPPMPFSATFKIRSPQHERVVKTSWECLGQEVVENTAEGA
ncbi:hypothetical protein FE257_007835 [Aspergillus nanangensis]|uniref:Cytochrome P450 n=1 Tax=Aspergillus nanangensis TaxID=2582783 RepID=A0AAD4CZ05_ASPNN|nr:hypothetical protein FE257_007835 [Aspergillus nanangensis]